ncbi:MAG: UvrD-helicase domain-containing protein, partial [Desulfobulbales bacterium]|nr:UvrD-helicase domain-containing protein [Desulfobulbales bacterium]
MPDTALQPTLPETFDLVQSPLAGFNLIDASAGTGKTYTICGLVLRLLLEKDLAIEQILVVTYTEAATDDLRSRIRQRLRQALQAVNNPAVADEFLQKYLATIKDHHNAARQLSEALRSFDAAAIYTIHGFCQRMLLENSFESNTLFDTELVTDDSGLIREIAADFWRRFSSQCSSLFNQYAADRINPDMLQDFLGPFMGHPFFQFIPDIDFTSGCSDFSEAENEYSNAYSSVCNAWTAARREVVHDLLHSQALNRRVYKKASMEGLISAMDDMAETHRLSPYLCKNFTLLSAGRIAAATRTKQTPNILPFYKYCEDLMQARSRLVSKYDMCLLALKKKLLGSYRQELALRKERDNVFSFDDLLRRLHGALAGPGGPAFAGLLAAKYPAALIDEFQDTDPLQYEIFKTIYKEGSLLFLIGDPKQAIYSFRGADIFTYMDAAAGSPLTHHTLGVNHRSSPQLVKAINTFFSRSVNPFVFSAISFQPVAAAPKENPEYLTIDGKQEEPFILHYVAGKGKLESAAPSRQTGGSAIAKTAARKRIISWVTAEVCRLLNLASEGRIRINKKNLLPGDIAILVRNNDEARKMQQALLAARVASVLHSGDDLFASEEAKELLLLLGAIVTPGHIGRIKTALLTRFMDLQADAISLLQVNSPENEEYIQFWLSKFKNYHELWSRYGFMRMFWAVMQENRGRQRMLASENGERCLTNILHLAEVLHREEVKRAHSMTALLGFLQDRMTAKRPRAAEHQLRLESDADRVKIVTIHKAKGLEYPVVFCPFTWEGSRLTPKRGFFFHRRRQGKKTELFFDAGSPDLDKNL